MRALGRLLWPRLTVFDAGLCGTDLYSTICATGAEVIMRAGAQFALAAVDVLVDGSYTAHLSRGGPLVRVIEYTVETDLETDQGEQSTAAEAVTLVTSLLDADRYPITDFPGLHAARWEAEILFDAVKTELRGGTAMRFRSQSPDLVRQEALALLLVYQAVSDLIIRAAGYRQLDPGRVSFTTALKTARRSVNCTGRRFSPLSTGPLWICGRSASSPTICCPCGAVGGHLARSPGAPSGLPPASPARLGQNPTSHPHLAPDPTSNNTLKQRYWASE